MNRSTRLARVARLAAASAMLASVSALGGRALGAQVQAGAKVGPGGDYPYTAADVYFMSGMIPHHAQAVLIAGWAPSHGASEDVQRLCERIVVAQRDEIALMRNWLEDRHEQVPDSNATHMRMNMGGMTHDMLMPGMLNDEELAQLDKSRGVEFDKLFLADMIKHHQGAVSMVNDLFGTNGAGQDEVVFRFASDVYADQTTEIDRMQKMLAAKSGQARTP